MSYRKQLWWLPSYVTVYLFRSPQRDHVIGMKDNRDNRLGCTFTVPLSQIRTLAGPVRSDKPLKECHNVKMLCDL